MSLLPTGRLLRTANGHRLALSRSFRAPAENVWDSITEPDRTARWFGRWEGEAAPGRTIKVQMAFEDGQPWCDMLIEACEPPRRLLLAMVDEAGAWRMELLLSESGGTTELQIVHHLDTTDGLGEIGPGWEYYLDMLVSAREGSARPDFDDYYPAMKRYFEELSG
ncbi:SRPBCC family protein [Saccharopolyspora indica]|uniref:SRPBCC family protein n=1 Tax=Saccharopolyspora indica TaxID=1229659 RepID=UPI0022EB4AD0|nr:SRPBCC family protein [Saccharopolyspora indica]MDA3644981.1 SRPBCC family protein [Saccharopolyspora indica]